MLVNYLNLWFWTFCMQREWIFMLFLLKSIEVDNNNFNDSYIEKQMMFIQRMDFWYIENGYLRATTVMTLKKLYLE